MPKLDLAAVTVKTGSIYPAPFAAMMAGRSSLRLAQAGGITQFGANLVTLNPGALSSLRHWHAAEDEVVVVLSGACTLVQDAGSAVMRRGDAACFPAGVADGHHFVNLTDAPATFLVVGTKAAREVGTYSDVDLVCTIDGATATFTRKDGAAFEALPQDETLPPPPPEGHPKGLIALPDWQEDNPTHPILGAGPGHYRYRLISDPGGITQFGCFVEELPPGSRSGHRHWHEAEDEMILMLEGEVVLVEDAEAPLNAGDVACWPAGHPVGHRLDNRGAEPARYIVIGTRLARDRVHYTDHDLITEKDGATRRYLHRDGTPYPTGESK
ncbi:cupin domain-containing protein [Paragemmobacter ruber]|uniref:Cupin domain-containing protein n=1 Tax=Paragemmobacter ruber TaxID=1985673 RepID=A0ABW9Y2I1_9RHOB|nr:cupin domain-containing protein [Rhodobacter ruber]NBE06696.1 cupin domain-containing protein [Rhodobacter ruber]